MKRRFRGIWVWFGVALLLLAGLPLRAVEAGARFAQANTFYELGKFDDAVQAYDTIIVAGGESPALYFNRGNALFKQGKIGRAIASYRLAQQMAPRDPEVRSNLRFARTQARGGVAYHESLWQRWVQALTLNEWTLLTVAAFWVLLGILAFKEWRSGNSRLLGTALLLAGLALTGFGIGLAGSLIRNQFIVTAIVVTGEATVRNGPLEESAEAFKVRDGIELEVLDRQNDWLQVVDSSQRIGWVRADQTLILGRTIPGAS